MRHYQRGQVLPLWIVALLTTMALTFLALNYGNQIRMQIRAQNAADAAAQALLAIQTERWNMMTEMLYASSVEEYRIRHLLDAILLVENGSGGCDTVGGTFAVSGTTSCGLVYTQLVAYYEQAVNRYTTDVMRLNDVTAQATIANWQNDAASLFTHLQAQCNLASTTAPNNQGGDCAFKYKLNGVAVRNALTTPHGLDAVAEDAYVELVPALRYKTTLFGADTENQALFAPPMVDVVVCTKVQPIIPAFGSLGAKPYYAVGRAGATAQIYTNEWLQPGSLVDSARASKTNFQPVEKYVNVNSGNTYDWYGTDYGGETFSIVTFNDPVLGLEYGYAAYITNNQLDASASWWSSIPIDPRDFDNKPVDLTTVCS